MILRLAGVGCERGEEFVLRGGIVGEGVFLGEVVEWTDCGCVLIVVLGVVVVVVGVGGRGLVVDFLV